jgi:hypothetical protein
MLQLFKSPTPGKASRPYRVCNANEWKKLGQKLLLPSGKKPLDGTSDVTSDAASDVILILSSLRSRRHVQIFVNSHQIGRWTGVGFILRRSVVFSVVLGVLGESPDVF